jgi:CxxC motif-containing protein (DUF1111 family)
MSTQERSRAIATVIAMTAMLALVAGCTQSAEPTALGQERAAATVTVMDPGPRPGAPGAGAPVTPQPIDPDSKKEQKAAGVACLPGLASDMLLFCQQAIIRFQEIDSVSGTVGNESGDGLGPAFNGNSCAMCHAQPAVLGSSPGLTSPQNPIANPQVALARLDGAGNVVPSFITAEGPVREVRFQSDGGVHDLYTIAGRVDAPGCVQQQPKFSDASIIFRIPTPLFGLGLVENTADATLENNPLPATAPTNASLGITGGVFNRSGNDGTITRFGWKAQNKSLLIFVAEAYNVEQGVTNEGFPNERAPDPSCLFNGTPEDATPSRKKFPAKNLSDASSDTVNFAMAARLSAPPTPAPPPGVSPPQLTNGQGVFIRIGCANCHSPTLTTGLSSLDPALSNVSFHPYSDFALHHMGTGLADGIQQGNAGPDQFRTAPLWGVGQRLFFLHDGRATDLGTAINAHSSNGSEANAVIANFGGLSATDRQDLVSFLRSL